MLEIKERDAGGRICKWSIGKHNITTPTIAIVINPNKQIVTPKELKEEFGCELIITNAYIIKNADKKSEIESKGIHDFYDWQGPIYFDSGTFQMYSQGKADIGNKETIDYQMKLGADIVTPLDEFTLISDKRKISVEKMKSTIKRINEARKLVKSQLLNVPIQGGKYLDLRSKMCKLLSKQKADVYSIGGIVPLMEQYKYDKLIDIILTCKSNLPPNVPVHAFGAGHPMLFSLLVALGIDIFDSAAYALYASNGRYMTVNGTKQLSELKELPCNCPICAKYKPMELTEKLLAKHNLYVTFSEIRTIKQAIHEGRLWELVESRVTAHPELLKGYIKIQKYFEYLEKQVPVGGKKAFFELSAESSSRPEILRLKKRTGSMQSSKKLKLTFSWLNTYIPKRFSYIYPISQSLTLNESKIPIIGDMEAIKGIIEFQYGRKAIALINKYTTIEKSSSGRIKHVYHKGNLIGTVRASDSFFIPTKLGAQLLFKYSKNYIVDAKKNAVPYILEGKSLFCKFVGNASSLIRPGDEVFITNKGKLIGIGTALLNREEMMSFEHGVAVKTRHGIK